MANAGSSTVVASPLHQPELKRVMGAKLLLLFIVGDILGTGIYAVTGSVAKEVGGVVWLPFLVAFIVATLTAFSYLELVTKYPQAAGAALYTHRAFGLHFFTFLICFTVMCSGITSASTASRAFAANLAAFAGVHPRRQRRRRPQPRADPGTGADLHRPGRGGQPARRGRERQGQYRADLRGAERPADRDLRRHLRRHPGQGGLLAGGHLRHSGGQVDLRRGDRRHLTGLLRHGRLRGLGEHGRGGQGTRDGSSPRSCSPAWASPG